MDSEGWGVEHPKTVELHVDPTQPKEFFYDYFEAELFAMVNEALRPGGHNVCIPMRGLGQVKGVVRRTASKMGFSSVTNKRDEEFLVLNRRIFDEYRAARNL